jgi:hypothetical protein
MGRVMITFLALLLSLTNIVLAMDIHAEALTGQHHPAMELHADADCGGKSGENHLQCHHCCHAQGHLSSLPQRSYFNSAIPGHDWVLVETIHPRSPGYAPPVPPPKV